jgi:signal transduction histidine kinase
MNRRILIQVTMPAVVIGLLLFGACLAGIWYVDRLQTSLARLLSENVASQAAAQELEIHVRRLRFHSFVYLVDPTVGRSKIDQDHENIETSLARARQAVRTDREKHCVQEIEAAYQKYHAEVDELMAGAARDVSRSDLAKLATDHPVQHIVGPAQELVAANQEAMREIDQESQRVARQARITMICLALVAPISGLLAGYGMARGLSRSIYQLSVRVRDMAHRLEQDVASVSIEANGDLQHLDQQLSYVVQRVEEVTERQQRHQSEMLRAEQLAAVGQLAAGVAHEIRNPLTAVKMLVEVALRSPSRGLLTPDDLHVIHREVTRLEHTVQGFLDFARLPAPRRMAYDLREIVKQAVELVQSRSRQQKVSIETDCPEVPMVANVDREQLRTVLINLLINGLDAMPQGGRLRIALTGTPLEGIVLSVADTGHGIAAEIRDRLFRPFTTTKETGTGLGLSISQKIVEEHGGSLTATNNRDGGACFTITLPPVESNVEAAGAA